MKIKGWNKNRLIAWVMGTFNVHIVYYKLLPFFSNKAANFTEKNHFSQISIVLKFSVWNRCALSYWSQKYLIFVSTSIFKVTRRSKVKTVKTGSRIIFEDFHFDSYRFWGAESEYDLRFALRLILTSQWRHKHVSPFLCLKQLMHKSRILWKVVCLQTWSVCSPRMCLSMSA